MKNIILLLLLFLLSNKVYSNNLFESLFYEIEFTSNNIEDEKIKEINKIKIKSFLNILKKTLDDRYFQKTSSDLSEDLINTFVKNIIINDEKIINNKYQSKIKINFDQKKIIQFFREKNIPYVEYHPDYFLLIINERDKISDNLFTRNNNFYKFYNQKMTNNKIFKIPNLDINDRFILNIEDINNRDTEKIINFSKKYKLKETVVVIVNKSENEVDYSLILYSDGEILNKNLNYNEYEFEEFFKILENETLNLWKKINKIQNNSVNFINCHVDYYNMLELKEIRANLDNISVIADLDIKSISYKNIEYNISYFGNLKILYKLFHLNSLKINDYENSCVIKLQ